MKTVQFRTPRYIGDPLNAVRIFNEKEVDEIIIVDIDASVKRREPNYALIRDLAAECRMPLCYGGGVRTVDQFQRLVGLGVEKVAIGSAAIETPNLISQAAAMVGSQSVGVVMDVRRSDLLGGSYKVFTHNGTINTGIDPVELARRVDELGAGEIIVNNIDRDGEMKGFDMELINRVRNATRRPMTVVGGAGSLADIGKMIETFRLIGVGAGSLFVFKGVYRAVLINYPSPSERDLLLKASMLKV